MNVKELESKKLYKEYLLEIPYSEVNTLIDNKINELLPTVALPGFRKGKAPINIVKKKYENNVLNEIIENLVKDKTKKLLDDKKIKPLGLPRINIKKYEKEEPVEIEIKIDLEPEIKLENFSKLSFKKYKIDLDKKTLDKNYEEFLKSQKNFKKITNNRSAINSDRLTVNIETKDEAVPDFIKSQKNLFVVIDSDYQVLPDLGKKLIEKKVKEGDKIKLSFDLKEVLKVKDKKMVEFDIEVVSIEESVKFEISEDFLKKVGVKDEKELKENLKKNLSSQYDQALKQIEKKELMDTLDESHKFDLPEGILEEEFKSIWHRLEHAKKDNKLDEDDKNLSDAELKKRYNKISQRRVKLAILIQHIAFKNKISISEKELQDGLISYASQYPGQEKQIFDYFKNNPSSIDNIRGPLLEEKVIESILTQAKTVDKKVTIDEFKKIQEKIYKVKGEK
tara:strand:- start:676 stop:2025 length:1350 start_codon:yes stop_codon:yes gene_type:complete